MWLSLLRKIRKAGTTQFCVRSNSPCSPFLLRPILIYKLGVMELTQKAQGGWLVLATVLQVMLRELQKEVLASGLDVSLCDFVHNWMCLCVTSGCVCV